jgi:hypothetical protein
MMGLAFSAFTIPVECLSHIFNGILTFSIRQHAHDEQTLSIARGSFRRPHLFISQASKLSSQYQSFQLLPFHEPTMVHIQEVMAFRNFARDDLHVIGQLVLPSGEIVNHCEIDELFDMESLQTWYENEGIRSLASDADRRRWCVENKKRWPQLTCRLKKVK